MELRTARLCLDCEEVHDEYQCPICASDHFTYLSRWVPAPERVARPRPAPAPPPPEAEAYRQIVGAEPSTPASGWARTLMGMGAAGIGAAGLASLFLGARRARGDAAGKKGDDKATDG
ncbi:MAG TPA: hypothetical protein VMW48_16435 [Vicinamibacterales bacterium]|nr:hypothetical protein [Vicinamibacterales bacterium]